MMTVQLHIEAALGKALIERSRSTGVPVETFIERLLMREVQARDRTPEKVAGPKHTGEMTGPEKAQAFRKWARSFPADLPHLSLDDVGREALYRTD